jgi:flavin reductase (DIM6/NTAB) family NADH-FMN oxidoreductase RutF
MELDPSTLDPREAFRLMVSCVSPRPTFFLAAYGPDGAPLVGPFSYVNGVSSAPPVVMVSINPGRDGKKHICTAVEKAGAFVLAVATPAMFDAPRTETTPAKRVRAPLMPASPVQLECAVHSLVEVEGGTTVVLGRVLAYHLHDGVVTGTEVDPRAVPWIGQLGADSSCRVTDLFERARIP